MLDEGSLIRSAARAGTSLTWRTRVVAGSMTSRSLVLAVDVRRCAGKGRPRGLRQQCVRLAVQLVALAEAFGYQAELRPSAPVHDPREEGWVCVVLLALRGSSRTPLWDERAGSDAAHEPEMPVKNAKDARTAAPHVPPC
jgi:hypothetical protein